MNYTIVVIILIILFFLWAYNRSEEVPDGNNISELVDDAGVSGHLHSSKVDELLIKLKERRDELEPKDKIENDIVRYQDSYLSLKKDCLESSP